MSEQRGLAAVERPVDLQQVRAQRAALPTQAHINELLNLGDMLVKSGLLPQTVRTKEAAATVILKGSELGLPPMAAMEGIAVVQGKAVLGANLLMALVKREYGPGAIWVSHTSAESCTVSYRIPGVPNVLQHAFTMEDARRAGLVDKQTWQQYPGAMLRARCISAAVKLAFPEVVGGVYVAGELPGTEAAVTDDGDVVIDVTAGAAEGAAPRREPQPPDPEAHRPSRPRPAATASAPQEAAPAELDLRWVLRLGEIAQELPIVGSDAMAPADVKRVQEAAMREVVRAVAPGSGGSRKHLTPAQATEVARRLVALRDRLNNNGEGLDPDLVLRPAAPPDPETGEVVPARPGLPIVDAEPVRAGGEPGADRHTA